MSRPLPALGTKIAPDLTDFTPTVTAQKVLLPKQEGERYFEKDVVDKARDFATKMAYIAVNADNESDAKRELKSFISQNYKELEDCRVLAPHIKVADYDAEDLNHREEVASVASEAIVKFVFAGCKHYDPSSASDYNDFRNQIGFSEKDPAAGGENKITWIENGNVSDAKVAELGGLKKSEIFVWQRIFLATQRALIAQEADLGAMAKEAELTGRVKVLGEEEEEVRLKEVKDRLVVKYNWDNDHDGTKMGLAKTFQFDGAGKPIDSLSAQGLAMHMALYEMQETPSNDSAIFRDLSYEQFAELTSKFAQVKHKDKDQSGVVPPHGSVVDNGVFHQAIIGETVDNLLGGYLEFGGRSIEGDVRSRSLFPVLWALREIEGKKIDVNTDWTEYGETPVEIFGKFDKIEGLIRDKDSIDKIVLLLSDKDKELLGEQTDPISMGELDEYGKRQYLIGLINNNRKDFLDYLVKHLEGKTDDEIKELIEKGREARQDKVTSRFDEDVAEEFYEKYYFDLGEKFEDAKKRLKARREETMPQPADVAKARLAMVELFKEDGATGVKLVPNSWEVKEIVSKPPTEKEVKGGKLAGAKVKRVLPKKNEQKSFANHLQDYQFADSEKLELGKFRERKAIEKKTLPEYRDAKFTIGDEGLFSAKDSKLFLEGGILVAHFDQPTCLEDLAKAVEEMPGKSVRKRIEEGETVYNLAFVNGDDEVKDKDGKVVKTGLRGNSKYVLISQDKRGAITTFTSKEIADKEIFGKSQEFYEENFKYEARLALMQQAANISLVYLRDYIAQELEKDKKDVFKRDYVKAFSEYNKDLTLRLKRFTPNEKDSVEKRKEKMDKFNEFIQDSKDFNELLQGLQDRMKQMEKTAGASDGKHSKALAKVIELVGEIKDPKKLTSSVAKAIEEKARKHGQAQMRQYLQDRDRDAAIQSKLVLQLDDTDIEVIKKSYSISILPRIEGKEDDLKRLLSADIPTSSVPGISIFKPKPGDQGYFRYQSNDKNTPGKPNTAIVTFKLPTDEGLLREMDNIAYIYLPGTPQCYVVAEVDIQTGKIEIRPGVYHKSNGAYEAVDEKALALAVGGKEQAEKVLKIHKNFNVLAVCEQGGIRKGVSTLFEGKVVNKGLEEMKSKTTSATLNRTSRAKNLNCEFSVDSKGRVQKDDTESSSRLLTGLLDDAAVVGSKHFLPKHEKKVGEGYIHDNFEHRADSFVVGGVKVYPKSVKGMRFVYAADLPSGKSVRLNPPKIVLTYMDGEEEKNLVCDFDKKTLTVILSRDPNPDVLEEILTRAKNASIPDGKEFLASSPVTLVNGNKFPESLGTMKDEFNSNSVRIVLPVIAMEGEKRDALTSKFMDERKSKMFLGAPVIEYFKGTDPDPKYMPLTKENLSKLYKAELSDRDYNQFAAQVAFTGANVRVPVIFNHKLSDGTIEQSELELQGEGMMEVRLGKGKPPKSSCELIDAESIKEIAAREAAEKAAKEAATGFAR